MIKKGYQSKAKYRGKYTVRDIVTLDTKVECYSQDKGKVLFNPAIVKLDRETAPSNDINDIWFPYWITIGSDKEKYGQFAPMIGEKAFLELLKKQYIRTSSVMNFSNNWLIPHLKN